MLENRTDSSHDVGTMGEKNHEAGGRLGVPAVCSASLIGRHSLGPAYGWAALSLLPLCDLA